MITKDQLAEGYALNLRLIERQTASLSHADSLIQTPYNINCLNWVLGHMAVGRDTVHRLVGEEPLLSEGETNRYKTDSDPIIEDGEHVIQLERLLEILTTGQKRITSGFLGLPRKSCHRRFRWGSARCRLECVCMDFIFKTHITQAKPICCGKSLVSTTKLFSQRGEPYYI